MFIGISTIAKNASPHHTFLGVNIRGKAEPLTQNEPAAVRLARNVEPMRRVDSTGSADCPPLAGLRSPLCRKHGRSAFSYDATTAVSIRRLVL